jgi:hypothetical protein
MRRLLNILTALSLLLSLAAAGMWVRSQFVTEGWEFASRPAGMNYEGKGWYRQRVVESANGGLVWADYSYFVRGNEPHPDDAWISRHPGAKYLPTFRHRLNPPPQFVPPTPGYRQATERLTPDLRGRMPESDPRSRPVPSGISGVVEWWESPRRTFVAVSLLPLALAFALLPAVRGWRFWRRLRDRRRPAFPVLPAAS